MDGRFTTIMTVAVTLVLGACSSMGPEECAATDWSAIGFEDGSRGLTSDYFANHRKACAKHGITADFGSYQAGRDEGLVQYCQPSRGYNLGTSGARYAGVCDAALEEEFLDAYRAGHALYSLRATVNRTNARINARDDELDRVRASMRSKEAQLISPETTTEQRILLLADLKELAERTGQLEAEIEALMVERAHQEHELADYQNTVTAYAY